MKIDRQLGFLLLGIWLVALGLTQFIHLSFRGKEEIMGVLAIAAGVLLIIRR